MKPIELIGIDFDHPILDSLIQPLHLLAVLMVIQQVKVIRI